MNAATWSRQCFAKNRLEESHEDPDFRADRRRGGDD
jgi:hypothetical protein